MWGWGYTKPQDQWNNGRGIMLLTSEFQKKGSQAQHQGCKWGRRGLWNTPGDPRCTMSQSKPRELCAQADPYLTAETQGRKKPWSRGKQFLACQGAMIWLPEGSKLWTPSAGGNDNNENYLIVNPEAYIQQKHSSGTFGFSQMVEN